MQTIGERLEDARKRKGVSIREAAEATKIRGDYLTKFESNQFDFDLAEIYVRGFLRNYATYLKLPSDRILDDYESLGRGETRARQPSREIYGRMDVSISGPEERAEAPSPAASAGGGESSGRSGPQVRSHNNLPKTPALDPALVFKGLIIGGGIGGGAAPRRPRSRPSPPSPWSRSAPSTSWSPRSPTAGPCSTTPSPPISAPWSRARAPS